MMSNLHTSSPPMGWNSFDSYGCAASEKTLLENLEVMEKRLKPFGYEYFVVDNGWFCEYDLAPGQSYPTQKLGNRYNIDPYGRYLPSKCYFPNGLKIISDYVHKNGLKFGIHMMRGVNRQAVEQKKPIYKSEYTLDQIADTSSICPWCHFNYGVDLSKPGAQQYYNSVLELYAQWEIDFIKLDDATGFPDEIEAVRKAIDACGRKIMLSLSPGEQTTFSNMSTYEQADMLRITSDIWDNSKDLDRAFAAWKKYQGLQRQGLWFDLDMIPFGHLQLWNSPKDNRKEIETTELNGRGPERMCALTLPEKQTFLTMRALAASPLFMGGDLPTSDEETFSLITNPEIIACNQNGLMGTLSYQEDLLEIWHTPSQRSFGHGWFGIFNRSNKKIIVERIYEKIAFFETGMKLFNVWENRELHNEEAIEPNGCCFATY